MIELIERWSTEEGKILYNNILKAIKNNNPLAKVKDLLKHNGRYDLRGFSFPVPRVLERTEHEGYALDKIRSFNVKYAILDNIDFSYSIFYRTTWEKCIFKNSIFSSSDLVQSSFYACKFEKVVFEKTDLTSSILGGTIEYDSGTFLNTDFNECNLTNVFFNFPYIKNCNFIGSRLNQTDFNSSRISNCKFKGLLQCVSFRGKPRFGSYVGINPSQIYNEMKNVDFSDAILQRCDFNNGIDLSKCIFPNSDDYLVIKKNRNQVFKDAYNEIDFTWSEPNKSLGLKLIEKYYLQDDKMSQNYEVLYRWSEGNQQFSEEFFQLIKKTYERFNF